MRTATPRRHRGTKVFAALTEPRRRQVLLAARQVFARDGFAGANVNDIARRADISVGALYKYFRSKEDLFLALVDEMHDHLEAALSGVVEAPGPLAEKLEAMVVAVAEFSLAEPELVQLYNLCTTQALAPLAGRLSERIERLTAETLRALLQQARRTGEVAADVDPAFDALFLDNLFVITHFCFGTSYYRERLRLFTGKPVPSPKVYARKAMAFLSRALALSPARHKRSPT